MNHRFVSLSALVLLAGLGAAACGSDTPAPAAAPAAVATTVVAAAPTVAAPTTTIVISNAGGSVAVKAGSSEFGQILVDPSGNTLYAFTNDTAAASTCTGTCAEAWPPVIVDPSWTVAPGLDAGVFSTIIRPDGQEQLAAGRFPLYRFSGDARPGDVTGQGSGGVWFVVDTSATPITDGAPEAAPTDSSAPESVPVETLPAETLPADTAAAEPSLITVVDGALGAILVDAGGQTVYGFTKDEAGTPTCVDGCAGAWPPVIVDPTFDVTTLPHPELFSIVTRPDGSSQLKVGKWPLYYFSGDTAAGETNGQGSGGVWFVVAEDGSLIK